MHVIFLDVWDIAIHRQLVLLIESIMGQTNSSEQVMVTPYLHFTGGGNLYFKSRHPSSHVAIAGASIVLVILAILRGCLTRGGVDARWRRHGLHNYFDQFYFIVGTALLP
jgi:hypothetical protein